MYELINTKQITYEFYKHKEQSMKLYLINKYITLEAA